uniref:Uncharacterized protein n=1 Tax=Glycine max TaxID=3847 RepID=C6T5P2_SOYBN|nr:unknown [Glycine max]
MHSISISVNKWQSSSTLIPILELKHTKCCHSTAATEIFRDLCYNCQTTHRFCPELFFPEGRLHLLSGSSSETSAILAPSGLADSIGDFSTSLGLLSPSLSF